MKREPSEPRPDWQRKFEDLGFHFHSADGGYWDERACFQLTTEEVDRLEAATEELHRLCISAVGHVIVERRLGELAIPSEFHDYLSRSWQAGEPSLYGRFDLCFDGSGEPKMLEYNADTPTSIIESAIAQWNWQQELHADRDQFNSLHEKLIDRWREIARSLRLGGPMHFACVRDNTEDVCNLDYLRDTAMQAGIDARYIAVEDIGWDDGRRTFVDMEERPITALFKLYPWEWMMRESFGPHLLAGTTRLIEPAWKSVLSNKGILAILWELFPGHPNLLPAYFEPTRLGADYVRKPLYSREGENVTIHARGSTRHSLGSYGAEGYVYQAHAPLPNFGGGYVVMGSWIVGNAAAGVCLREDVSPITRNTSRFVPHYFI
jgi:glutathionylspermidine synthase